MDFFDVTIPFMQALEFCETNVAFILMLIFQFCLLWKTGSALRTFDYLGFRCDSTLFPESDQLKLFALWAKYCQSVILFYV